MTNHDETTGDGRRKTNVPRPRQRTRRPALPVSKAPPPPAAASDDAATAGATDSSSLSGSDHARTSGRGGHARLLGRASSEEAALCEQWTDAMCAADAGAIPDDGHALVHRAIGYLDAMLAANAHVNLTAIRDRDAACVLHALDSLMVHAALETPPRIVIDLGSGNGFPGVAAAASWPDAHVICIERTQKKARAITECAAASGLSNLEVVALDAAQVPARVPGLCDRADVVLSRAMADLATVVRYAVPLLARDAARLVQWKSQDISRNEREAGERAAAESWLGVRPDILYPLPPVQGESEHRVRRLVVYERVRRAASHRRSSR
ncbi:MAG: class I SAM-dependent methyltransferase [Planctomycetes bacterium]|nr:class I SAM-dependent methyltransferase [Planctomycetota bacterium]